MTAGEVGDAASLIRRKEGFRSRPYWDANAWRIGYGSDTITRADGSTVKVAQGMEITREDAERDLQRRIPEFQKQGIIQHVGQNTWDKLNDQTKAAITSLAYNYGSISRLDALKKAIEAGDKNMIAQAVESYSGHNNGVNYNRRMEEARMIRTSSDSPTVATEVPQLPQGLEPKLVEEYNRMPAYQQRNFHRALNKAGENDVAVGVNKMNELYVQNPNIAARAASSSFSVGNLPIPEEGQGKFNRHSGQDPYQKRKDIVAVQTPYGKINVTKDAALAYQGFFNDLKTAGAPLKTLGSYNIRQKNSAGPGHNPGKGYSEHSYGNAVDLDNAASLSKEMRDWLKNPENAERFSRAKSDWGMKVPDGDEPHMEFGGRVSSSARERLIELHKKEQEAKAASGSSAIPSQPTVPALSVPNAPAGPVSQQQQQPQATVVPSEPTLPGLPGLALGGEVKTDAQQLQAHAINKSRQRRDDMVVTDGAQPLFTMNSEEEMKFNPATGKVSVNPSPQGLKTNPDSLLEKLEPPSEVAQTDKTNLVRDIKQEQDMSQQPIIVNQSPATPAVNSYDSIRDRTLEKMTPSFERAIARSRFLNSGDSIMGGHFDSGAANMS
jgi:GH24 family phage-related lysozyme (muramidase)